MLNYSISFLLFVIYILLEKIVVKKQYSLITFHIVFMLIGAGGLISINLMKINSLEYFYMLCLFFSVGGIFRYKKRS